MEINQALKIIRTIGNNTTNAEINLTFNNDSEVDSIGVNIENANTEYLYQVGRAFREAGVEAEYDGGHTLVWSEVVSEEPKEVK